MKTPTTALLCLTASLCLAQEEPTPIRYFPAEELCQLEDERIAESSGVAVGRANPKLFWTHNDSGDTARIFAFDAQGKTRATVTLAGASAVDWEDIASFSLGKKHYLLAADVGDNRRRRPGATLYLIREPKLDKGSPDQVPVLSTIGFTWEGGAQNCEAVAVDGPDKTIYLATRDDRAKRSLVFTLPLALKTPKAPLVAQPLGVDLGLKLVTGMDMSPDGRRAVVVTYSYAHFYARGEDESWKDAFARAPERLRLPRRRQGEAVCYGADERSLYLTTEKLPAPVHVFRPKSSD